MARQHARRHQRERLAGIGVIVLGAAVLVIAIIALRQPSRHAATSSATRTVVHTVAPSTPASAATSTHRITPSTISTSAGSHTSRTSAAGSSQSSAVSTADAKRVPLLVLNNTTVTGLAAAAAQRFENAGWTVTGSSNLTNNILSTCAYYDPATPNAKAAAQALQDEFPTIRRVEPKFAQLPAGPVVVVLTSDYSAG